MTFESLALVLFCIPAGLLIVLLIGFIRVKQQRTARIQPEPLTLVVPFRNEKKHLPQFLHRLNETQWNSSDERILVDDGSTDGFVMPDNAAMRDIKSSNLTGVGSKKIALQTGILEATNDWILTTDADSSASIHWPNAMRSSQLADALFVIGPVFMLPDATVASKLAAYESLSLWTVTAGTAGWKIPLLCSGANILFRKSQWEKLGRYTSHLHNPSGDDVLLMHSFWKENHRCISVCSDPEAAVYTEAPTTMSDWFAQRKRWASKSGHLAHPLKIVLTTLIGIWLYAPFGLVFLSWQSLLIFTSLELFWVIAIARMYSVRIKWLEWLVFRATYPLLLLAIPFSPKRKWKG